MGTTWQVGIIGLGVMGQRMLARLQHQQRLRPCWVWDADPQAVRHVLAQYPDLKAADSAHDLIAKPGLHSLYIATPPAAHIALSHAALDMGLAVLCEKPLSVDSPGAQACVARIAQQGSRAAVNFPMASASGLALAQSLFGGEGTAALGPLQSVEIDLAFAHWPRPWQQAAGRWLAERQEGGFSREVLSHFIFALQRVLGPTQRVHSAVTYPADPTLAEIALSAELQAMIPRPGPASAAPVTIRIQARVGGDDADFNQMRWQAQGGELVLGDWFRRVDVRGLDGQPLPAQAETKAPEVPDLPSQWAALIEGGPHQLSSYGEALAVQETVESLLHK